MIVKKEKDLIYPYTFDTSNHKGFADKLVIPESVEEFRSAVEETYNNNEEFIVAGAGTGITGGRVPNGGTVISTEKLKKIYDFDPIKKTIKVQAGVTLNELDSILNEKGFFYPPNPTEWNSSIGGNLSTNASGSRTFKYGSTRYYIKSISVVVYNGKLLTINRGDYVFNKHTLDLTSIGINDSLLIISVNINTRKHAAGLYVKDNMDLIDLLIGSEGILCCFTEAELQVFEIPESILGGLIFFDDCDKMLDFVSKLRDFSIERNKLNINENSNIAARLIEYFDENSLNLLRNQFQNIPEDAKAAIWFEQEYHSQFEDDILTKWYEFIPEFTPFIDNSWFATSEKEHRNLAEFRHALPLIVYEQISDNNQRKIGTDTAVPVDKFTEYFHFIKSTLSSVDLLNVSFGHIGDCHIHTNIFVNNDNEYKIAMDIYDKLVDKAIELGGTVSAEHGIGKLKKKYLNRMFSKEILDMMKNIKKVFDPKLLLAKGTMLD